MMEKERKLTLARLGAAAVLAAAAWLWAPEGWPGLCCFLVPYLLAGYETLREAAEGIVRGGVFEEDFLMSAATLGALAIGEYPEAVAVMLLFQVGELFEDLAGERSRSSIAALMDLRPDFARTERGGEMQTVAPEEVTPGEVIAVYPGEKIPLDGEIISGSAALNTAALTGEAAPRDVKPGDTVLSGSVDLSGVLRIRVTKPFGESTAGRILALVEDSAAQKSRSERFITRFAARYTPAVCIAALLLALIPPLLGGVWADWLHRALVFLVVSCPCALVISVPLTFFAGIGGASARGILIKGGSYMDALCSTEIAVFDKTGTLTKGSFAVSRVCPVGCTAEELAVLAAKAERCSAHPIARSLRDYCGMAEETGCTEAEEIPGRGVRAEADGKTVYVGSAALMEQQGLTPAAADDAGTAVHVCADGAYLGYIVISDGLKPGAADALRELRALGVQRFVMLTGDRKSTAERTAAELGIGEVYSELLPGDKVAAVERLLSECPKGGKVLFAGDGINDAPVLARADLGAAMGALGSDAAIEAADIVLMDDRPEKLAEALRIARRTRCIVKENIVFALAVKFAVLVLAAAGAASMWAAAFADVGVCVLAVLNAMRALKPGK